MDKQPSNTGEPLWRRNLTATERGSLRGQPALELEASLTEALAKISDVPVASNFTARVIDAVELEEKQAARSGGWHWNWHSWFPRVAVASAVLIFAGISIQRYEVNSQRFTLAKNISRVAQAEPLPNMDALENLDAIQRMSQSAHADGQLLADLQ